MATQPVKTRFTYTIKDFYKEYRSDERKLGKAVKDIVPYAKYRLIVEDFFCEMFKKIIYDNFTFMMPYSLGSILVKAVKTNLNNLKVDWKRSREVGKIVKHLNTHSFGYYFTIVWDKSYVRFRNNAYYLFTATSSKKATDLGVGKKGLSNHIKELSKDPNKRSYIKI